MCTKPFPLFKYRFPWQDKWSTKVFPGEFLDEEDIWLSVMVQNVERQGGQASFCAIPCGQCVECRLKYSRMWANRCVMEASLYENDRSWFVTLTYAPDKIFHLENSDGLYSLNKTDSQAFMKRLRRHYEFHYGENNIRFFMCGEYGDQNGRPHYHFLLFNCPIFDKKKIAINKFGDSLYTSKTIEELWSHGIVCIAPLNWNTAAYTARYVMKKQTGQNAQKVYDDNNLLRPFTLSSRNPGIAAGFYELNKDMIYDHVDVNDKDELLFYDKIILPSVGRHKNVVKPPRYFDKLLEKTDAERIALVKEARARFAQAKYNERHILNAQSDREFFEVKEYTNQKKGKGLIRKMQELT